jgi:hypothetical protein
MESLSALVIPNFHSQKKTQLLHLKFSVLSDTNQVSFVVCIDATEVNVGDVCILETGDEVPADGILFQCYGIFNPLHRLCFHFCSLLNRQESESERKKRSNSVFLFDICVFVIELYIDESTATGESKPKRKELKGDIFVYAGSVVCNHNHTDKYKKHHIYLYIYINHIARL